MVNAMPQKPTEFAPAERASEEKIAIDAAYFERFPMLQQVLDAVPDIFLVINAERQIIFANYRVLENLGIQAARRIIGMRPGEAINCQHADNETGGCGTSEACKTCGALKAFMVGLNGRKNMQECRITQKDGQALDLSVWATPITVGDAHFSVFTLKDISHEKRRRALERIFFHDLLNTAGVINGFLDLVNEAQDQTELESYLEQMRYSATRLISEINGQKQLSAAENDELEPFFVRLDALALLREIEIQYARNPLAQGRRIEIATHSETVFFVTDHTLLGRVLGNLVKNALEASKEGETVTLYCGMAPEGGVEFTVHNPAVMPRRVQLQVFNRSFSTKGPGRGLGTYSIKLLTERYLGGKASFESVEGVGTTFTVRYPPDPPGTEGLIMP